MQRRRFIRLVGGGAVAAATGVGLVGCSADFPAAAVEAWHGPSAQEELRRWALSYAILAPNSHNRQPWIADLREANAITVFVDRERLLPMTDPWFRQIMVSQGTFIESLLIALRERGAAPQLQLFPQGEFKPRELDGRAVARISWQTAAAAPPRDVLFAQLLRRQTAKVEYDITRPVAPATLETLRLALEDPMVQFAGTVDAQRVGPLRTLCLDSARVEISTPRTMLESMQLIRVGSAEIARYRDGISVNKPLARVAALVGAFDRTVAPPPGSMGFNQILASYEGSSRTAMGFVWLSTPTAQHAAARTQRSAEVSAGRAYMRLQLTATELGLQVHPMSQAPQEFPEMRQYYDQLHTLLLGKPATEETVQMFCRIGYCPTQQHTPRRALNGFLRA